MHTEQVLVSYLKKITDPTSASNNYVIEEKQRFTNIHDAKKFVNQLNANNNPGIKVLGFPTIETVE